MKKLVFIACALLVLASSNTASGAEAVRVFQSQQLTAFSKTSSQLSPKQKSEIKKLVLSVDYSVETLLCTGVASDRKQSSLSIAKSLASKACTEAKKLDRSISVKIATKVSTNKALARRVLLDATLVLADPVVILPIQPSSSLSRAVLSGLRPDTSTKSAFIVVSETEKLSPKNQFLVDRFSEHLVWASRLGLGLNRPLVVVYPKTAEWMNAEIERQGCSRHTLPLGGYAIWQDCGDNSVVTRPDADSEWSAKESLDSQHGLIHEALHQWQRENTKGRGNADYPKWVWEGGAQALSRYIYWLNSSRLQTPDYLLSDWYTTYRSDLRTMCLGIKIREMIPNKPWWDVSNCAYSKGQVAIDVFVEKYGLEKFLTLFQVPKQGGMGDFPSIFRSITGDELEPFYDLVDREMELRGWR